MASPYPKHPQDEDHAPTSTAADAELLEALASFGLVPAPDAGAGVGRGGRAGDGSGRQLWLWPDNRPAWELWLCLGTQWRVGMAGATGLDYSAVAAVMHMQGTPRKERSELLALLRVMEAEVLEVWARQREKR